MGVDLYPAFMRIEGNEISLEDVFRSLSIINGLEIHDLMVERCIVVILAQREGISISSEQLQDLVNEWRYQNKLESPEDTTVWLERQGVELEDVAYEIEIQFLRTRLKQKITDDQIREHFANRKLEFDKAEICWIVVGSEDVANEIALQVNEEGKDFYSLARQYSEDEITRPASGFLGCLSRKDFPMHINSIIFSVQEGKVVGPTKIDQGYALYYVQKHYWANLDLKTRESIIDLIFDSWVKRERKQLEISFPFWESVKTHNRLTT